MFPPWKYSNSTLYELPNELSNILTSLFRNAKVLYNSDSLKCNASWISLCSDLWYLTRSWHASRAFNLSWSPNNSSRSLGIGSEARQNHRILHKRDYIDENKIYRGKGNHYTRIGSASDLGINLESWRNITWEQRWTIGILKKWRTKFNRETIVRHLIRLWIEVILN